MEYWNTEILGNKIKSFSIPSFHSSIIPLFPVSDFSPLIYLFLYKTKDSTWQEEDNDQDKNSHYDGPINSKPKNP
jgi:hypothetical protein